MLNLPVRLLQHAPDVLRHRAGSAVAGVNADEGGKPIRLQGRVNLVQGNLSWILAKFRAALPPGHRNESCLLQGTEGVADHNRITAGALRQQRTRDTRSVSGLPDKEQTVHRYGTFGGRVPAPAVERLSQMKANGAKAILVCVYGNRAYEDTLVELQDTAKQAGFRVIAGVAAVAEHSIVRQFAAGRPDEQDKAQLCQFAQEIHKKLEHGDGSEPQIPGHRPYHKSGGAGMVPKPTKACVKCGLCAEKCPVQAIDRVDPAKVDKKACISCMRCVSICPHEARKVSGVMLAAAHTMLQKACVQRKNCECFL